MPPVESGDATYCPTKPGPAFNPIFPLQHKTCKNCKRLHNPRGNTAPNAASEDKNIEENRWLQQETATALDKLATVIAVDRTTLDRITDALATANANIVSLKSKLKNQINPADKDKKDPITGITAGPIVFDVVGSTPVHPSSG